MLISEVVVKENYFSNLILAVQDLLVTYAASDRKEIPTQEFKDALADSGYDEKIEVIVQAVDRSGFANSVDTETIVPLDELPATANTEVEPSVDVAAMADQEAMGAIKNSELPQ